MKTKKISHIKVQSLRNGEMRAANGGTVYECGSGTGDDCTSLVIHMSAKADLLSVYKKEQSEGTPTSL
jgi:hypothetical protein